MGIEFRIGDVERSLGDLKAQKFIVSKYPDSLVYYARALITTNAPQHDTIRQSIGLQERAIVGGGLIGYIGSPSPTDNPLQLRGSSKFGGMPAEIMNLFVPFLLPLYQDVDRTITKIFVESQSELGLEFWLSHHGFKKSDFDLQ